MIHVAEQVFEENAIEVESHYQHSSRFNSKPIDLIVSETLDCAVFGEGFVSSIVDLKKRLAPEQEIRVLPAKATVHMALCEARKIENMHFCEKTNEKGGYVLLSSECYLNWPLYEEHELNDPYDSATLDELDGGYRLLSDPVDVITVDFNNFEHLEKIILRNNFEARLEVTANKAGRACCVAVWFT
jgi:hypothetical protein